MNILLAHNYYGSAAPSGENQVFETEAALLWAHGHTVEIFTGHSDEIRAKGVWGAIQGACAVPWNPWTAPPGSKSVLPPDFALTGLSLRVQNRSG